MTFEQWWAQEHFPGLHLVTPKEAERIRSVMAGTWNAALDAALEECGSERHDSTVIFRISEAQIEALRAKP
jgi:hypothetical protein